MRIVFSIILISGLICIKIWGQSQVDLAPKSLIKDLQKIYGIKSPQLIPIQNLSLSGRGMFFYQETGAEIIYTYVGRVNSCRTGGCSITKPTSDSQDFEFFDYYIIFDGQGKIRRVRVHNYEATHGYEITVSKWLDQFIGFDGTNDLSVGKDINAITGATISVYNITADVMLQTSLLKNFLNTSDYIELAGETQGTTFKVIYRNHLGVNINDSIKNILVHVDTTFSLWNAQSVLSRINRNEVKIDYNDLFLELFNKALKISELTNGAFDITVNSVKNYSYKDVVFNDNVLVKSDSLVQLDFNGIAQGATVDLISEALLEFGISDFLVEVGGELRCLGKNFKGMPWTVGIDNPQQTYQHKLLPQVVELSKGAISTSGNYRNQGHIKNPFNKQESNTNIQSVTVVADECYLADGLATAFVVMGLEKTIEFLKLHPNIKALVVSNNRVAFSNIPL